MECLCIVSVINTVSQESVSVETEIALTETKGLDNLCNKFRSVNIINFLAYKPCFNS